MNIWAAAAAIAGVAIAGFASVLGKMIYKEVRDARTRRTQLPPPPMDNTSDKPEHGHEEEPAHASV